MSVETFFEASDASVETITLGCRLNFAESEVMKRLATGETTIINSCAVTAEAERQTRQAIRRARRERPEARIVVTGCAAQLSPERYAAMPEVDLVLGNVDKLSSPAFAGEVAAPGADGGVLRRDTRTPPSAFGRHLPTKAWGGESVVRVSSFADSPPLTVAAGYRGRVRSFVSVQTGCDHRCTFCSIWQARGPSRSLPYGAVRDAVERELDAGAREIVLTGVDVTSHDMGLGLLCQQLLGDLPRLERLRLSSLDSIEIDPALMELIAGEPRLMPHFHLSLQAGDDLILKRMKRRHSRADGVATVSAIKAARADATIGADLIAGFPTESEEAALNTMRLLDDCDVIAGHIFPYSPRPNTPAARMPQVEREIVKARAARLRERAAERRTAWLASLVGTRQRVLIENRERGHSDGFAPIAIAGSMRGDSGTALVTAAAGGQLIGEFE